MLDGDDPKPPLPAREAARAEAGSQAPGFALPWRDLLVHGLVQLCSLRALDKYLPLSGEGAVAVAAGLAVLGVYLPIRLPGRVRRLLERPAAFWLVAAGFALVVLLAYPKADALKESMRGSDADDALIVGAHAWLAEGTPYAARTYLGHPLSPGPGWILLLAPLSLSGLYPLATPLLLATLCWLVGRATPDRSAPLRLLAIPLAGLGTWEISVVGGDYLAIGFAFAILALAIHRDRERGARRLLWCVLLGLVLTSRLVFSYLLGIFVLLLWPGRRAAGSCLLVAGATMAGLHLYFWQIDPAAYAPLHLLAKPALASAWTRVVLVATCLGYAALFLRLRVDGVRRWEGLLLGALLVPLAQVAAAQGLLQAEGERSFAGWEAANYLMPCVGPALAWLGLSWAGPAAARTCSTQSLLRS
jgi:hypothetical protein